MKQSYEAISGWLVIDKPQDITSFDVIRRLKKLARFKKIGHTGTLDPFATGVLVVALGSATRLIEYAMDTKKRYSFRIRFGETRDTLDRDGQVIDTSDARTTKQELLSAMSGFIGTIEQVPPKYSAIKVDGQRAYDMARNGVDLDLKARSVELYELNLIDSTEDYADFDVLCGKGFYIRSLARDICEKLGVLGYVENLRRTLNAKFTADDAILLPELEKMMHNDSADCLKSAVYPLECVLDGILVHRVDEDCALRLSRGQQIYVGTLDSNVVAAFRGNELIAICEMENGCLRPKKVFIN